MAAIFGSSGISRITDVAQFDHAVSSFFLIHTAQAVSSFLLHPTFTRQGA
jgi:hypothetical protein